MSNSQEFGPLPKADSNDELQQRSLLAFRGLVPVDRFLCRDERVDDKGVDLSLELKAHSHFTNFRSQVQLKATERDTPNDDGSYSLPIAVSNLNYLLNGPSPLFVLWLAPTLEFRFIWARDEARRLHRENPAWTEQKTVMLRFRDLLGNDTWDTVYQRILTEGQLHRQTHDSLARAAATSSISIKIDPATLGAVTSDDAYQIINESGFGIVSAGYASFIRDRAKLLAADQHAQPKIRLICGYAAMALGDYFSARADLGRALVGRAQLDDVDRYFLDVLLVECDEQLGRISTESARDRRTQLEANAPRLIALQLTFDRIRRAHLDAQDESDRISLGDQLRQIVAEIDSDPQASESIKLQARLSRLYCEAINANTRHNHNLLLLRMRRDMGYSNAVASVIEQMRQQLAENKQLDEEVDLCLREAVRLRHPLLIADTILARAVMLIVRTVTARLIAAEPGAPPSAIPDKIADSLLEQLRAAESLFRQAQNAEGTVRAALLQADWLETVGRHEAAVAQANSVEVSATGMGYAEQVERIARFRSGTSHQRQILEAMQRQEDTDTEIASASDEDLRRFAQDCLDSLGLPAERLPVVERDCHSLRDVAIEQRNWCRHLEVLQDLRHSLSPSTHYLQDPNRRCVCKLHRFQSVLESTDWVALITAFKRSYCAGCGDRSPENGR